MSTIEMTGTAREYRELQAAIKELEAQSDALRQKMIREMDAQQVEEMTAGEYTIRYALYESARLDATRLKKDHAVLYSHYSKKSVSARFSVA
jgi:predicted phage-related endonuclease